MPNGLTTVQFCLLVCLLVYMSYRVIVSLNPYVLGSDLSNEISFRRYSWEHKSLISGGFAQSSELFASRPVLLYWLFYGITHDFLLSYSLEAIAVTVLQLVVMGYLCKKLRMSPYASLTTMCVYLCVFWRHTSMFGFITAYSMFAIMAMLALAMRICVQERAENTDQLIKACWLPLLVLAAIPTLFGFTTVRMIMSLYVPLLAVDGLRCVIRFINGRKIERKLAVTTVVDLVCLLLNAVSYFGVTIHLLGDSFTVATTNIKIKSIEAWLDWDVLSGQLRSVLAELGIRGTGSLASLGGITFCLTMGFVAVAMTAVIWLVRKKEDEGLEVFEETKNVAWYFISATVVMFVLGVVTGSISERYYWATPLMFVVLCGVGIDRWMRVVTHRQEHIIGAAMLLAILALSGVNAKTDSTDFSKEPPLLAEIAEYIEDEGYEYVTSIYRYAGVITGYTNGRVDYQDDIRTNGTLRERPWLIDTAKFDDARVGVPNVLLVTDEYETAMLGDETSSVLLERYGRKVKEFDEFNLYAFTENPFTLYKKIEQELYAGLPAEGVDKKTDLLSNIGFHFTRSALNDAGELVTDGSKGSGFYGPYSPTVAGTYDITLHYVVDSYTDKDTGTFDVMLDIDTKPAKTEFSAGETSVTLENVEIEEGHKFEVRAHAPEGMIVRFQSIDYERVG